MKNTKTNPTKQTWTHGVKKFKKAVLIMGKLDMLEKLDTWLRKYSDSNNINKSEIILFILKENEICTNELYSLKTKNNEFKIPNN